MRSFDYYLPATLDEAAELLSDYDGRVKVLAGGTDLVRDIKARRVAPLALIDVSRLPELQVIAVRDGRLVVGAAVTFTRLMGSPLMVEHAEALAQAAAAVGSPQIRNRGTIGGNIANASPAADGVPALLALEAEVSLESSVGSRHLPLEAVLLGAGRTALQTNEIITEISFALPAAGDRSGFRKCGRRRALAVARISIAASLRCQGESIERARIALGAVAPNPFRVYAAERALEGATATSEAVEAAVSMIGSEVAERLGDRASAPYKSVAVVGLARQLLGDLLPASFSN